MNFLLAVLLLAAPAASTPPTPAPAFVTPDPNALPANPAEIARAQFIAFATDSVNPANYLQPPTRAEISVAKPLLLSIGRIKSIVPLRRSDKRYGLGYAFRFVCEHGSAVVRFTVRDGKIAEIAFSKS